MLLRERGHRVTVVTGFPNSPSGVVPADYRGRLFQRERIDGIEVLRGWLFASPKLSPFTKAAGFASFAASGRLSSGPLIRVLERLERALYAASTAITVVTDGKRTPLAEKGVPHEKLFVIPNGVDLSRFDALDPLPPAEWSALGLDPERFTVMYAGIMNPAQGLDVLLDAAAQLRVTAPDAAARLQVALVGAGSERARLEERVQREGLAECVRFVAEQPRQRIPVLLRSA